jgi:hypothetical protein
MEVLQMRDLLKLATDDQLNKLFDVTLVSQHTNERDELLRIIADEYVERDKAKNPPNVELQDSCAHLMEKYSKIKENIPEGEDPVALLLALFDYGTDDELLNLRNALASYEYLPEDLQIALDALDEKLSGRDADPPRTKPKPRRSFIRSALIAACFAAWLFLLNSVTALATGFDFFSSLIRWSQDAVYFVFGERNEERLYERNLAYDHLDNVLDELGFQVDLPRYMPDGFVFDIIEPGEPSEFFPVIAWFVRGNEEFHFRVKRMDLTATFSEINEDGQSEVYMGKFLIAYNMDRIVAVWYEGIYELSIHGNLTREELTRILDSI